MDTANGESDIVPLINAMNEYHIKNNSDRVRSVMAAKARDGQKISGHAPYGYLRSPEDHTRLAVDEYAAGVVRKIFAMRAEGAGYGTIVRPLNSAEILPPLLYYYSTIGRDGSHGKTRHWTSPTLQAMLRKEVYIGPAVQFQHQIVAHTAKRGDQRPHA